MRLQEFNPSNLPIGEPGTTCMAARSLGLVGHLEFSTVQKEKSPEGFPELCVDLSECTVARKVA